MNESSHSSADGTPEERTDSETKKITDSGLERSITELADPIIASVLRKQFYVSLRPDDFSAENQEALDVASEVRAKLIPKLVKISSAESGIENLEGYVRAAASNAFRDYLRKRHPRRQRLSNRLRYIVKNDGRFAIWQAADGSFLCGPRGSESALPEVSTARPEGLRSALETVVGESGGTRGGRALTALVETFFELHTGPVLFGYLVSILSEVLEVGQRTPDLDDSIQSEIRDDRRPLDRRFEDRSSLKGLWESICTLPVRHRCAVLLNLRTDNGDNALPLFPALRIASVTEIAEALEMPASELAELWEELPLDDLTIGERLGLSRQQVINLRSSARVFLRRNRA